MNRSLLSVRPLCAVLSTAVLMGLSSLLPCVADAAHPVRAEHPATNAHTSGSGIRIQDTVTRLGSDTVEVLLRVDGVSAADGATISYTLSGAGQITEQEKDRLPIGQVALRRITVRLAPGEDHYLNVFTRQAGRSSVVSIALDKGSVPMKAARSASLSKDGSGRDVILVPGRLSH